MFKSWGNPQERLWFAFLSSRVIDVVMDEKGERLHESFETHPCEVLAVTFTTSNKSWLTEFE